MQEIVARQVTLGRLVLMAWLADAGYNGVTRPMNAQALR